MRDLGLADRIRAMGVPVVEVAEWQSRGSDSFDPRGSVNHHTAGPPSGQTPSLGVVIDGRPDLAGPLANVLQSREPDGNDIAYIIASGRANHAGEGGWHGLSGNSSVYGLEIEHDGVTLLPEHRQRTAARIHAAMLAGRPRPDPAGAEMCCQHSEWTSRKIDAATGVDAGCFRQWVAEALAGSPAPISGDVAVQLRTTNRGNGYWIAASDGGVFAFGNAPFWGSMGGQTMNAPVVGIAAIPDDNGYWLVASDGGVFAFGAAQFHGSLPGSGMNAPVVGIESTPSGGGYWLLGSDGGVFAYGDAGFYGSAVDYINPG
jgi:hypothetical protein